MITITKMICAFFLLSLFTLLGSQARMLSADSGENGELKPMSNSIKYNKEKKWISMVADQIITTSSFMISNYRKYPPPSPPPPRSATPLQPGINDYCEKSRFQQLKSGTIISSIIKKPTGPPPPAPGASPQKMVISEYSKTPKSPPPPPYVPPTKGHISWTTTPLKPGMSDYEIPAQSPPPSPYTAPTIVPLSKLYDY